MKIFQQEISESHRNLVKGQQMAKILPSYAWFVLGENGADESLIFYQNGTFVITQNNEEKKGLWQYNSTLQTLYDVEQKVDPRRTLCILFSGTTKCWF